MTAIDISAYVVLTFILVAIIAIELTYDARNRGRR